MIFESIDLEKWQGIVECKSKFYTAFDNFSFEKISFTQGVNYLVGDIDSGMWAISYLLSMYQYKLKCISFYNEPKIYVNGIPISLEELTQHAIYLDPVCPLFSKNKSIYKLSQKYIKESHSQQRVYDIFDIFNISVHKRDCLLNQVGNDLFQVMAAIGISANKKVFCLPWMSEKRFQYYQNRLDSVIKILTQLDCIVIVPRGR